MAESNQLLIPEAVKSDPKSFEILRIWIANKEQHISIRFGTWKDPYAWGMMLADLAELIANAYSQDAALDKNVTLRHIKTAFENELKTPTDKPRGHFE